MDERNRAHKEDGGHERAKARRRERALARAEVAERARERAAVQQMPSCCSSVERIRLSQEGGSVATSRQCAWQISNVQQLIGLSRRDIQRACYQGEGGVGILHPADSAWGRRSYDVKDLAALFVVRRFKEAGMSLPEIRSAFDEAHRAGGDVRSLLEVQTQRLREERDRASDQLVRAEALRVALGQAGQEQTLADLITRCCLTELIASEAVPPAELAMLSATFTRGLKELGDCIRAGQAALSKTAQDVASAVIAEFAATPRRMGGEGRSERSEAVRLIGRVLASAGMDLAVELWLGAGSYEYVRATFVSASEAAHA